MVVVVVAHCLQEVQKRRPKIIKEAYARPFPSTLLLVQPLAGDILGGRAWRQDDQGAGGWRVG